VIAMLRREANTFGKGASHTARVAAMAQLARIYGMNTVNVKAEHSGGVMVVPMASSLSEWAQTASESQATLMADTMDICPLSLERHETKH
jgi:hypothetical protein